MADAHSHAPAIDVVDHPLAASMLASLRDASTRPFQFRDLVRRLGAMLAYEATRRLHTQAVTVRTPLEETQGTKTGPVVIMPILRAGLAMADGMLDLIPDAQVGHLGMFRDEKNLTPTTYYTKIPADAAEATVLLADPMLATGGSASEAIGILKKHRCKDIRLLCLIAAPEGIARIRREHTDVPIICAAIDRQLSDKGYILPGLGDAGDRIFGTTDQA